MSRVSTEALRDASESVVLQVSMNESWHQCLWMRHVTDVHCSFMKCLRQCRVTGVYEWVMAPVSMNASCHRCPLQLQNVSLKVSCYRYLQMHPANWITIPICTTNEWVRVDIRWFPYIYIFNGIDTRCIQRIVSCSSERILREERKAERIVWTVRKVER